MSKEQLANLLITNNQALGYKSLNSVQMYHILTQAGVSDEIAKATVKQVLQTKATNTQTVATIGATAATGGLRKAIRGLWATMLANPLTTIIAIATIAIPIIIKVHDWISKAAERHADAMRDFQSKNEQAVSDLNNIKSELSDVKKRLEELDKLAQNGRLTPDQEAERKDLQATNQELERQLWLKQQLAESSAQSAAQAAYDAYSTKTYGSLSGDVDSYLSNGRPARVEYNGPEMMYDLLDAMREIDQKKKVLDDDVFSRKISVEDRQRLIQGLDASYTMYQSKLAEVAGEQQEFADAMAANSAFDKERLEILAAVDAWRLYGATEQEKLHYIAQSAPKAMQSAAQELVDLADAMDAFQDGNVDLKIRPEVEIEDGSQSFISSWEKATLGDENEYAIHLTPILSEENVLTENELSSYFDDLVNGAVSKSDILEKDSVENGGKGLILSVKPRIDGQTDEQFATENDQWEKELKKQQARYRDVIRKLRDDAGIQEWINKAVEAGIASGDVSDLLFRLAQAIIQVNDAAEDGPLESYADSLKSFKGTSDSLKDYYKALQSLKDLNGTDIPIDLMAELMELCPEAVGMIHSVADAQQALTDKITEQKTAAENTYSKMILSNQEWLEKTINASSSLQKTLATYYGADLENFRKLAGTKWEIEQALVSNLASLWSKYENRTLESLENQLYYLNYQAPDPNMDQIRELQAIIDMRKALTGQLDDLITYKPSTVHSKSKDDALKKEIEAQKNAFSEVYNAKKHLVDMDQMLIEDFYAWLDGQDGYKKYFSDLSKYADEYRKYEKEVYDGLQKVHSDYLSDLEFEIDILERQFEAKEKYLDSLISSDESIKSLKNDIMGSVPSGMKDAAKELLSLADAMDEFQEGNVDLKIRPEVEIDDGYATVASTWNEATLGDNSEYAIQLTPILPDGTVLTNDELWNYFDNLIAGAVNKSDVLYRDSVINGGKGIVLAVRPRIAGQSYQQFFDENNTWGVQLHEQQEVYYNTIRELRDNSDIKSWISKMISAGVVADDSAKSIYHLAQVIEQANRTANSSGEIQKSKEQISVEEKLIAKLREKQEVYRQLILETEAYLRSVGMSEAQIARNDLVQEYTKAMYAIEDSVRDVEEKLFDSARDKINDLIDLTKELVKQEQEDKIDALEDQKDAYADIISMKKELLQLGRREREYNDEVAEKTKNIQKLQSRIEALSLDDSREAAIKKAALQEELAELQKDLTDKQYDHYIDTAEDALDKELKDFEDAQDEKVKDIRKFLNDNEALNREALNRLDDMNKELFDKLEKYALQYTQTTREELVDMWNEASRAAEKYGTMANVNSVFSSSDSSTAAQSILQQMKENGNLWATAKTDSERNKYADANLILGEQLQELLEKPVYRDGNGVWWVGDQKLFTYHSGTPNVGRQPTLKQNEVWAKLEMGEGVVTPKQRSAISQILSFFNPVDKIAKSVSAGQMGQYQFAGAGGPNITVQMPLTLYGDMTNETIRVLKDHARQVAEVVSKTLRK